MDRRYTIVVINERTGQKYDLGLKPMSHHEACTMLSKMTQYKWRRAQLEELT